MENIIYQIRSELVSLADEKIKEQGKRFFKEEINAYGIKTALVSKLARGYFNMLKDSGKNEIFLLCEELWKSGYLEESFIACNWSYKIHKSYAPDDFRIFEKWLSAYVSNWASCDTLCNHTIGTFIEKYPEFLKDLKEWTRSKNRWVRRGAAVSLIIPARKGILLNDILEISDNLLTDNDDMVQKGYGWMLKAASQAHQQKIFDYIMNVKDVMPRTALRYSIEKMPDELKREAMKREKN
jgi:3-methyladenine DNA glycosylase AlkD